MEDLFTILFVVIFLFANIIGDRVGKKNRPPQVPPPNDPFDIPNLANDPNFPGEESNIWIEDTVKTEEVRPLNIAEIYRQKRFNKQVETPTVHETKKMPEVEEKNFGIELTPASAVNAVILAEVLGKPKALRRR